MMINKRCVVIDWLALKNVSYFIISPPSLSPLHRTEKKKKKKKEKKKQQRKMILPSKIGSTPFFVAPTRGPDGKFKF